MKISREYLQCVRVCTCVVVAKKKKTFDIPFLFTIQYFEYTPLMIVQRPFFFYRSKRKKNFLFILFVYFIYADVSMSTAMFVFFRVLYLPFYSIHHFLYPIHCVKKKNFFVIIHSKHSYIYDLWTVCVCVCVCLTLP